MPRLSLLLLWIDSAPAVLALIGCCNPGGYGRHALLADGTRGSATYAVLFAEGYGGVQVLEVVFCMLEAMENLLLEVAKGVRSVQ